jgi:hypothetical protein
MINPWERWPQGHGALSQNEFVPGFLEGSFSPPIQHVHYALFPINFQCFMTRAYSDIQLLLKSFRCHDKQAFTLWDVAPDMIRQPTVRKRDILISLENDYLRVFVQTAKPGRG